MKNYKIISILFVILFFTFSCKKEETANSKANISAKVEGTLWTGSTTMATHISSRNYTAIIGAGTSPYDQIVLEFIGSVAGTYVMNDNNLGSVVIGDNPFSTILSSSPVGQIVITKYDEANKLISGTFYFNGEDIDGKVYHVTEGKFENIALTTN